MSREWGLHCKTCNSLSMCEFNHGELLLRSLVKAYPHIQAMKEADKSGYLEVSIVGYAHASSDLFTWLAEHSEHDLELHDEYGNSEPLEGPAT